jgi:hypothetical protein
MGPSPTFSLGGEVRGTCVTFETREETPDVGVLHYTFTGTVSESGSEKRIRGTFTGSGPVGCLLDGDFEVTIR